MILKYENRSSSPLGLHHSSPSLSILVNPRIQGVIPRRILEFCSIVSLGTFSTVLPCLWGFSSGLFYMVVGKAGSCFRRNLSDFVKSSFQHKGNSPCEIFRQNKPMIFRMEICYGF